MLDKLKVIMIVGVALQFLRAFFPDMDFGAEFEGAVKALIDSVYVLVPIVAGWFTKESKAQVARLVTR